MTQPDPIKFDRELLKEQAAQGAEKFPPDCTACGKPMDMEATAFWIGPDAPRHGNCANYAEDEPLG